MILFQPICGSRSGRQTLLAGRTTRKEGYAKGDLCSTSGAAFPFAKTVADRTATGDSRLSNEERYASEADYREKLKAVADQLIEQRLMARHGPTSLGNLRPLASATRVPDSKRQPDCQCWKHRIASVR